MNMYYLKKFLIHIIVDIRLMKFNETNT